MHLGAFNSMIEVETLWDKLEMWGRQWLVVVGFVCVGERKLCKHSFLEFVSPRGNVYDRET